MKILFYISVIAISVGGALYLLIRYGEQDDRLSERLCILFTILGLALIGWGVYFHYSNVTIWSSFKGPINGGQVIVVGTLLSVFSGFQAFKLMKRNKKG
jgi:hypothetical protein